LEEREDAFNIVVVVLPVHGPPSEEVAGGDALKKQVSWVTRVRIFRNTTWEGICVCLISGRSLTWYAMEFPDQSGFHSGPAMRQPQGQRISIKGDWQKQVPKTLIFLSELDVITSRGTALTNKYTIIGSHQSSEGSSSSSLSIQIPIT
jgi:hypothetical protein